MTNDEQKEKLLTSLMGNTLPYDCMRQNEIDLIKSMIQDGWVEGQELRKMQRAGYLAYVRVTAILEPAGQFLASRNQVALKTGYVAMSKGQLEEELVLHRFPAARHIMARKALDKLLGDEKQADIEMKERHHREQLDVDSHANRIAKRAMWISAVSLAVAAGSVVSQFANHSNTSMQMPQKSESKELPSNLTTGTAYQSSSSVTLPLTKPTPEPAPSTRSTATPEATSKTPNP